MKITKVPDKQYYCHLEQWRYLWDYADNFIWDDDFIPYGYRRNLEYDRILYLYENNKI